MYALITDQGYAKQPHVVWESMESIDGDCTFFNSKLNEYTIESEPQTPLDEDPEITAKRIQQEKADKEFARQLQNREDEAARQEQRRQESSRPLFSQQNQRNSVRSSKSKKEKCLIM